LGDEKAQVDIARKAWKLRGAWRGFAVVCLACCAANPAWAEDEAKLGTLTVAVENDRVVNTDRHYTNGIRVSWVSPRDGAPDWTAPVLDTLPQFHPDGDRRIGYSAGQLMFTPDNIAQEALIVDDRPYAGWLYGAMSLHTATETRRDSLELALGVVGPASLAEPTQKFVHEVIQTTRPLGWDNQLSNEPGILITAERQWRKLVEFDLGGLAVDGIPAFGLTLGNIWTFPSASVTMRVGQNLPQDFGPPRIRPSLPGSDSFVPSDDWGWYIFGGAEGRYVARNIFLDGNTFSSSHSVKKIRWVGDFQAGVAVVFRAVRISYMQVFRTREFEGQPNADRFGAVSISFRY